ncbi:hypothetical protein LTR62_005122 [Meristemomyces frigidus]|uniref:Uncharacterized protein n=1 Tax=Meristemomyces frigidus TaxID=1508187 RepID=A0AAN7TR69_9PEZI|nr:hypothetical protein LTR62_005122 [Meristemomyces frigidus]
MADHPLDTISALARAGSGLAGITPARSQTNPTSTQKHERSHFHRRLHSNTITGRVPHVHRRHRSDGKEALRTPTSATAAEFRSGMGGFDGPLSRRERKEGGGVGSKTFLQQQEKEERERRQRAKEWEAQRLRTEVKATEVETVKATEVEKVKAANETRELQLRKALQSVEDLGMTATRQLDDTYYSILEKTSLLSSTCASLVELAQECRRLSASFSRDAGTLEQGTRDSISAFAGFEAQGNVVEAFVERLRESKDATAALDSRLEAARGRIEAFERRDRGAREGRRRRWRVVWCAGFAALVLVIGVLVLRNRGRVGGVGRDVDAVEVGLGEVWGEVVEGLGGGLQMARGRGSEDPRLGELFDEL